jgi:hypothetical protein
MGSDGFHRNGSSLELESWSDFDFSFAFDNNNVSDLKTKSKSKSKGKAHFLVRLRQQQHQEVVWCSNNFIHFFFCRGGNKIFWEKYFKKKFNFFFLPGALALGSPLCVSAPGFLPPFPCIFFCALDRLRLGKNPSSQPLSVPNLEPLVAALN